MKVKIIKFTEDLKLPVRGHYDDAGLDIYMFEKGSIKPGETKIIPTGFGIELPTGTMGYMQIRTSLAKKGLILSQCAIDSGYRGEIKMILHNISNETLSWEKNDRLGSLIVLNILLPDLVEDLGQAREDGAFGSTGR